jgi:hypothetical protein
MKRFALLRIGVCVLRIKLAGENRDVKLVQLPHIRERGLNG